MGAIIVFIVLAVMWALLAVPRQREARRRHAVLAALAVGDEVMTGGGIYGTIVEIGDDHVLVEVAPTTVIKVAKKAVASIVDPSPAPESAPAPDADSTVGTSDRSED